MSQGSAELFFFRIDDLFDQVLTFPKFRIFVTEDVHDRIDEAAEEHIADAEEAAETDGTTQDTAQDVAAAFVGRQDTVGDHDRNGPDVVGNDLHSDLLLRIAVIAVADGDYPFDNREDEVCFKVRFLLLNDRSQSFETAAGIDVFLFEGFVLPVLRPIELGEDEIPDFKVPVAVTADVAGRLAAAAFRAEVVEDFAVRTAGAFADFPEVVVEFEDPFVGKTDHIMPVIISFFIIRINGNVQFALVQFEYFR